MGRNDCMRLAFLDNAADDWQGLAKITCGLNKTCTAAQCARDKHKTMQANMQKQAGLANAP